MNGYGHDGLAHDSVGSYLYPSEEQVDCIHIIVLCLPECQELKVGIDVWLLQKFAQQLVYFDGAENVEHHRNDGKLNNER